jgi:phosphatidyl-myo-inositol dimannoside synthase
VTGSRRNREGEKRGPSTVLAILPSAGLGGGIERYCEWLFDAVAANGTRVVRVALLHPGEKPSPLHKLAFLRRCLLEGRRIAGEGRVVPVICHPSLAVACIAVLHAAGFRSRAVGVLFYGHDIWSFGRVAKWLLRRSHCRVLTISRFSAGGLVSIGVSQVLTPGLARNWYEALIQTPRANLTEEAAPLRLLTVFRLDAADSKGLPLLLDALGRVRDTYACHLTVAGSGTLPSDLSIRVDSMPWVSVVARPTDNELAQLYAAADVFVLATRTRVVPPISGEGFGMALVEAQLTGTPVVAPAFGGSDDAFLFGMTGVKPTDESADALADVIEQLASDPELRARLGENGRLWAQAEFNPDRRTKDVQQVLLQQRAAVEVSGLRLC